MPDPEPRLQAEQSHRSNTPANTANPKHPRQRHAATQNPRLGTQPRAPTVVWTTVVGSSLPAKQKPSLSASFPGYSGAGIGSAAANAI